MSSVCMMSFINLYVMCVCTSVCVYVKMHAGLHVRSMCVHMILYLCITTASDYPTDGYSYQVCIRTKLFNKMISGQVVVCK